VFDEIPQLVKVLKDTQNRDVSLHPGLGTLQASLTLVQYSKGSNTPTSAHPLGAHP
jgi:hypothetical protein